MQHGLHCTRSDEVDWDPDRRGLPSLLPLERRVDTRMHADHVAAAGETPNVSYTDRDRCLMDTGRMAHELRYAPQYLRDAAYADFIEWIGRNRDFYIQSAG